MAALREKMTSTLQTVYLFVLLFSKELEKIGIEFYSLRRSQEAPTSSFWNSVFTFGRMHANYPYHYHVFAD